MARLLVVATIGFAGFVMLVIPASRAAEDPATAAAQTQPAIDPAIAELVSQLGDADPQIREKASKALWSRGHAAEPALRQAGASDNPEVARRAKAILRDFSYGLYPDAPPEVFTLLDQYRRGDFAGKRMAVLQLSARGIPGVRVLLRIRQEERDANLRELITQLLGPREHEVAVLMLAGGQESDAEQLLEKAAYDSPGGAQDYAALLALDGKLPAAFARTKDAPITSRNAVVITAMARAAGDLNIARAAAEKAPNPDLLDAILIEQGDWKALAQRLESNSSRMEPPERLGFLCAYYRLAGDSEKADKTARQLVTLADQNPQDYSFCAENLFLNDHPEEGVLVLLKHNDYLQASSFLGPRLRFKDALHLAADVDERQPAEALKVKAKAVGALHFIGEREKVVKLMDEIAAENKLRNDFSTWAELVENARELDLRDKADEYAAAALEKATPHDPVAWMLQKVQIGDGSVAAAQWWRFLRRQHADESAAQTLRRLRSIYDRTLSDDEIKDLDEAARRYAAGLAPAERQAWQETVADTLARRLRSPDAAAEWYKGLEREASTPAVLIRCGDFEASQQRWSLAADDYDKAFERDHTQAPALFLHGWALLRSGRENEGRAMMDLAHKLPLGSESGRQALLQSLIEHKLTDDARREMELILTVTPAHSWERNEALRQMAEDAAARGDYLAAADMWQRAFLQNLSNSVSFMEPWANVVVPALIHKTRALGLIKAGRINEALTEAKTALDEVPADADALIEIVNALDRAGHRNEADSLYQQYTSSYRKLIGEFPQSGPAHNQLAWTQVKCDRDLDDALKNARRAVELEPTSTASIDTLAEVYFTRGQVAEAIEQIKRCIQLEPTVERHRQQLKRFEAALRPATQPN